MPQILCDVCQEDLDLDKFRFLLCGHGFCVDCTKRMAARDACPVCRAYKQGAPRKVYATFADAPAEEQADALCRSMNIIGPGMPSVNARKLGGKLKDTVRDLSIDHSISCKLFDAAFKLEGKIEPLYWELKRERDEKTILQSRVLSDGAAISRLEAENALLSKRYREVKSECATAKNSYQEATIKIAKLSADNAFMRKAQAVEQQAAQDGEITRLRTLVEDQEKQVNLLKKKLRALTKAQKVKHPRQSMQDEDSLMIEPMLGGLSFR